MGSMDIAPVLFAVFFFLDYDVGSGSILCCPSCILWKSLKRVKSSMEIS